MKPMILRRLGAVLLVPALLAACDRIFPQQDDLTLPAPEAVQALYAQHNVHAEFRYSGNVVEMIVQQPREQLRRGGALWARVGPYIYLFSPGTRQLFDNHPGVAGVRVITVVDDEEVARALLQREALNDITWRRAYSTWAQALEQGTERPSTLDRLVSYGEQVTEYQYNEAYVPPR
jgi:hypothetical protein